MAMVFSENVRTFTEAKNNLTIIAKLFHGKVVIISITILSSKFPEKFSSLKVLPIFSSIGFMFLLFYIFIDLCKNKLLLKLFVFQSFSNYNFREDSPKINYCFEQDIQFK